MLTCLCGNKYKNPVYKTCYTCYKKQFKQCCIICKKQLLNGNIYCDDCNKVSVFCSNKNECKNEFIVSRQYAKDAHYCDACNLLPMYITCGICKNEAKCIRNEVKRFNCPKCKEIKNTLNTLIETGDAATQHLQFSNDNNIWSDDHIVELIIIFKNEDEKRCDCVEYTSQLTYKLYLPLVAGFVVGDLFNSDYISINRKYYDKDRQYLIDYYLKLKFEFSYKSPFLVEDSDMYYNTGNGELISMKCMKKRNPMDKL